MKNLQAKILFIFGIIGIVIIFGMGGFFHYIIDNANQMLLAGSNVETVYQTQLLQEKILILGAILVFCCIIILLWVYIYNTIIAPMNRLVKSAEAMSNNSSKELARIPKSKKKHNTEFDKLANVIGKMTGELKQNLADVKRQKNEIEAIFLHINDGILAFDEHGKIVQINPAAKELLNINEKNTFQEIFNREETKINMEAIMYLDNWTTSEVRMVVGEKTVNVFLAPYKDENDFGIGIIAVIQDITEHVKLDNMRKEFVADVSHELKTPITSIIGYADTLQDGDYDKETSSKFLSVISSEGHRMADLVSDLLTLSRYDTNRIKKEPTEFDLGELAKKCEEKLKIEVAKKKQEIECYVTADVPPVFADKNGIERVILNVLSNAIKYTGEGGKIKIYVGFVYNDAYIKVIDNGIGIPEADLSRIFERFYRVDKARSRDMGGTGLGLSIAKEILDQNNGNINIKSEYGKGTEVVIRIPAVKKTEEKD